MGYAYENSVDDIPKETYGTYGEEHYGEFIRANKVFYTLGPIGAISLSFENVSTPRIYILNGIQWYDYTQSQLPGYGGWEDNSMTHSNCFDSFIEQYNPIKVINLTSTDVDPSYSTWGSMIMRELDLTGVPTNIPIVITTNAETSAS